MAIFEEEFVRVDINHGIAVMHLTRPPMNALNLQMQRQIAAAADLSSGHREIHVVVLYGGPKVFAAGADVKEMANMSYADMAEAAHRLRESFDAEIGRASCRERV